MMTHPATDTFSAYLDQELSHADRAALEAHVAACAECATLLAELRIVVARAKALDDRAPRADLWPGVAAAIGATPPLRRGVTFTVTQLLAAGIALMLLTGGAVAALLRLGAGPSLPAGPATLSAGPAAIGEAVLPVESAGDRGYDTAVRQLTAVLEAGRGTLDTATVRIVEEKLALIDRAITEAQRAVAADPGDSYLRGHLVQTRLRKLDLLRRAASLSRAAS